MAVFFKFNELRGSVLVREPSALRIDTVAAFNPQNACVALQLAEEIGGRRNLFASIPDGKLAEVPLLAQQAVSAAPAALVDIHGFVPLQSMGGKNIISASDMFRIITPGNQDGTCSHISFASGYRLPSEQVGGIASIDMRSKTSDVIAHMQKRGHVFIDLTVKP